MRIGIIGGTGSFGKGLAIRLSATNQVLIGSRNRNKGEDTATQVKATIGRDVTGGLNEDMANACDVAILAIANLNDAGFLEPLKEPLRGKIVISPIVPMRLDKGLLVTSGAQGSAAEEVGLVLKESKVVAALHHIPALTMMKADWRVDFDVLTACDSKADYEEAAAIIRSIEGLRPLYVGPLFMSRVLESMTPLLINTARLNKLNRLSLKLVS